MYLLLTEAVSQRVWHGMNIQNAYRAVMNNTLSLVSNDKYGKNHMCVSRSQSLHDGYYAEHPYDVYFELDGLKLANKGGRGKAFSYYDVTADNEYGSGHPVYNIDKESGERRHIKNVPSAKKHDISSFEYEDRVYFRDPFVKDFMDCVVAVTIDPTRNTRNLNDISEFIRVIKEKYPMLPIRTVGPNDPTLKSGKDISTLSLPSHTGSAIAYEYQRDSDPAEEKENRRASGVLLILADFAIRRPEGPPPTIDLVRSIFKAKLKEEMFVSEEILDDYVGKFMCAPWGDSYVAGEDMYVGIAYNYTAMLREMEYRLRLLLDNRPKWFPMYANRFRRLREMNKKLFDNYRNKQREMAGL